MKRNTQMSDKMPITEHLNTISKKLNIIIAILLAQSGVDKDEVAKVIGVSGRTIQRIIPFHQIKKGGR